MPIFDFVGFVNICHKSHVYKCHVVMGQHDVPTTYVIQPIRMQHFDHVVLVTINSCARVIFVRAIDVLVEWATCTALQATHVPTLPVVLPALPDVLFSAYTSYCAVSTCISLLFRTFRLLWKVGMALSFILANTLIALNSTGLVEFTWRLKIVSTDQMQCIL